jgi:hypothetical protein
MHNGVLVRGGPFAVDVQRPAGLAESTELSRSKIKYDAEGAEAAFYGCVDSRLITV